MKSDCTWFYRNQIITRNQKWTENRIIGFQPKENLESSSMLENRRLLDA